MGLQVGSLCLEAVLLSSMGRTSLGVRAREIHGSYTIRAVKGASLGVMVWDWPQKQRKAVKLLCCNWRI